VWKRIQQDQNLRLSQFDEAVIVWKDGSWMMTGRVLAADDISVNFKPSGTTKLPQQVKPEARRVVQTRVM
jgi:hypothetical protein